MSAQTSKYNTLFASGFRQPWERRSFLFGFGLTCFLMLCGFVFVAADVLPKELWWLASIIIMLLGVATFLSELRARSFISNLVTFVTITAAFFVIEYVGVNTGFPFGAYSYSHVLGFEVFGVPIAIAFAWYATLTNTRRIAEWIHENASPLRVAITAGMLTLALDIVLEPMAAFIKGYWIWDSGAVPRQNYFSWFVLSCVAVLALVLVEKRKKKHLHRSSGLLPVALVLYSSQFLLFALTNVVNGFIAPPLAAFVFIAVVAFNRVKHRWLFAAEGAAEK